MNARHSVTHHDDDRLCWKIILTRHRLLCAWLEPEPRDHPTKFHELRFFGRLNGPQLYLYPPNDNSHGCFGTTYASRATSNHHFLGVPLFGQLGQHYLHYYASILSSLGDIFGRQVGITQRYPACIPAMHPNVFWMVQISPLSLSSPDHFLSIKSGLSKTRLEG